MQDLLNITKPIHLDEAFLWPSTYDNCPNATPIYMWCSLIEEENNMKVQPMHGFFSCREIMCKPIYMQFKSSSVIIEGGKPGNRTTHTIKYEDFLDVNKPTIICMFGRGVDKIKDNLKLIHHYEKLARSKFRTKVYSAVNMLKYTTNSTKVSFVDGYVKQTPIEKVVDYSDIPAAVIVGPSFWHFTPPHMSAYLLMLRVATRTADVDNASTYGNLGEDYDYIKSIRLSKPNIDVIEVLAKYNKTLCKLFFKHGKGLFLNGANTITITNSLFHWGVNKLAGNIRDVSKNNQDHTHDPYYALGRAYAEKAYALAQKYAKDK